jgi:hypothetical protein
MSAYPRLRWRASHDGKTWISSPAQVQVRYNFGTTSLVLHSSSRCNTRVNSTTARLMMRVETDQRFIEQQQTRVAEQRLGQQQAAVAHHQMSPQGGATCQVVAKTTSNARSLHGVALSPAREDPIADDSRRSQRSPSR